MSGVIATAPLPIWAALFRAPIRARAAEAEPIARSGPAAPAAETFTIHAARIYILYRLGDFDTKEFNTILYRLYFQFIEKGRS